MASSLLAIASITALLVERVALVQMAPRRHLDLLVVLLKMKRLFESFMLNTKRIRNGSPLSNRLRQNRKNLPNEKVSWIFSLLNLILENQLEESGFKSIRRLKKFQLLTKFRHDRWSTFRRKASQRNEIWITFMKISAGYQMISSWSRLSSKQERNLRKSCMQRHR